MPSVEEDLVDGMKSRINADGLIELTRVFFAYNLENPGGPEVNRFLSAYGLAQIPKYEDELLFMDRTLVVAGIELEPWPPADAIVTVDYLEDDSGPSGIGAVEKEAGSTLEFGETDFDAENLLLPYAERTPIEVEYDFAAAGAPGPLASRANVRVPIYLPRASRTYTRQESTDPGLIAEFYVGRTNRTEWHGYPPETVLCLAIVGRNFGQGWRTTYEFAIDRIEKFRQYARFRDPTTADYPALTTAQLAANNGIKEVIVQDTAEFNDLDIPT
jgi:hypothetical protein